MLGHVARMEPRLMRTLFKFFYYRRHAEAVGFLIERTLQRIRRLPSDKRRRISALEPFRAAVQKVGWC